jgi:hypothetical protein
LVVIKPKRGTGGTICEGWRHNKLDPHESKKINAMFFSVPTLVETHWLSTQFLPEVRQGEAAEQKTQKNPSIFSTTKEGSF